MITLDNPQLEQQIQTLFGDDQQAFQAWLASQLAALPDRLSIERSLAQLEAGQVQPAEQVLDALKQKYACKP